MCLSLREGYRDEHLIFNAELIERVNVEKLRRMAKGIKKGGKKKNHERGGDREGSSDEIID